MWPRSLLIGKLCSRGDYNTVCKVLLYIGWVKGEISEASVTIDVAFVTGPTQTTLSGIRSSVTGVGGGCTNNNTKDRSLYRQSLVHHLRPGE